MACYFKNDFIYTVFLSTTKPIQNLYKLYICTSTFIDVPTMSYTVQYFKCVRFV